jgi:hypothetical protein
MKQQLTIKTVLAIFVVIFGMCSLVFINIEDMVKGALIGYVGAILQYFFGSSSGSAAKDKLIQDSQKTDV